MRASGGSMWSQAKQKRREIKKKSVARTPLASDGVLSFFAHFFCLFRLSFSLFNLCYFDEATQSVVTMTESHTHCVVYVPDSVDEVWRKTVPRQQQAAHHVHPSRSDQSG